jgi:glycosyltransferase involved in cell wall biosynthesis
MSLPSKHIAILMSTYNGAKYVSQQIDSIEAQTHTDWALYVSDDGSQDETLAILQQKFSFFKQNKTKLLNGPRKGFCKNFLSMACNPTIKADYYAFSDQDDVWDKDKLTAGLNKLHEIESLDIPALYFGRTTYTKEDLTPLFKAWLVAIQFCLIMQQKSLLKQ